MSCDYCGKVKKNLANTTEMCTTKNIKMICEDCSSIITKKKHFFMFEVTEKRLKKWMERTRKK